MAHNREFVKEKVKLLSWKVFIVYMLFYLVTDFTVWPSCYNNGTFSMDFIHYCLRDITFWSFYIIKYSVVIIVFFLNLQRIFQYDGSTDITSPSYKKAERGIRTIVRHMLWWEGISVLIEIPGILTAAKMSGETFLPIAFILQIIGVTGIIGVFIYVPFLSIFEKWVYDLVPFNGNSRIHMGNTERTVFVVTLNSYSQVFIVLGCFICFSQSNMSINEYIMRCVGPQVIINTILSTLTTYQQVHGNSKKIASITKGLQEVAKNNYTLNVEQVTSREEFGLMTESMNDFITTTRELLSVIQRTTIESHVTARDLAVQTGITELSVNRIVSSTEEMQKSVEQENIAFDQIKQSEAVISSSIVALDKDVQNQIFCSRTVFICN